MTDTGVRSKKQGRVPATAQKVDNRAKGPPIREKKELPPGLPKGVCASFFSTGMCPFGAKCRYKHLASPPQQTAVGTPGPPGVHTEDSKTSGPPKEEKPKVVQFDCPAGVVPPTPAISVEEFRKKLHDLQGYAVAAVQSEEEKSHAVQSGSGYTTKVGSMWQRLQRFTTKLFLSEGTQKTLKRVYPHVQFSSSLRGETVLHPHPILNIDREMAEAQAYDYINRLVTRMKAPGIIVDAGGNPDRHVRYGRTNIHSCNPILSPEDEIRTLNHAYSGGITCQHTVQQCTCVKQIAAHMSVDSLYYLNESDIADMCLRNSTQSFVAVCHEFPDAFGSFADGEARYQQIGIDTVSMNVKGNSKPYVHSNLSWLRAGSAPVFKKTDYSSNSTAFNAALGHATSIPIENEVRIGTLVWSLVSQTPFHSVYCFHFTYSMFDSVSTPEVDFSTALLDPNHYGPISMSALNEKAKVSVRGDMLYLPDLKVYSWGPFVMVYKTGSILNMMCPKDLVSECAVRCALQIRSPDNYRSLVTWAKFQAKSYSIPPHILSTCITAAVSLAFIQDVSFEVAVMHALIKPNTTLLDTHESALSRKFKWVWTASELAATATAYGLTAAGIGVATHAIGLATAPAAGIVLAATGLAVAAAAAASRLFQTSADPLADYRANRASNGPRTAVIPLPRGTQLPATAPSKTIEELLDPKITPLSPSAKLVTPDPLDNREASDAPHVRPGGASMKASLIEQRVGGLYNGLKAPTWQQIMPLMPAGLVTDFSIPVVPENSSHSAISAITERILKASPFDKGEVDDQFFDLFRQWVFNNLGELGLLPESVQRMSFDDWNNSYSKAQRESQTAAKFSVLRDDNVSIERVHHRGMFTKIEFRVINFVFLEGCCGVGSFWRPRG
jgi:hypothetical protein